MSTLAAYIEQHLQTPFEWGRHDCVLFAARWVQIATGVDHLAGVPPWHGEREALRMLRECGGLEALLDARFARVHPNMAHDGALAIYENSVCIVTGAHIVGPGLSGLTFNPRTLATCAWQF